ncbi:cytochrome b/b6 domain-containing protein [Thiocystis violacea]|uniref:cytochrome b/b6 domain-containing protein n=1 Tax=Thiocystis violacea TaxID=13725 RepID=UPI001906E7AE|nr:cytochrome b/b6 domain-containing protein [Thiocystis violacea]MBK1722271.1 cytochrome B [Thiocystis violacea]
MSALYLYSGWVRTWHWINALLFLVLIFSGASMHFNGAGWLLDFQSAILIHNTAGILLTIGWIGFIVGNLVSDNGRHYRVRLHGFVQRLMTQSIYYGYGIFKNAPHPFHPSAEAKLNTLQQVTYIGVMYVLMPLLILSGWAFLFSVYLPETLLGIGSVWVVAMLHLSIAYFLVLFLLIHLYIITTGETVMTNMRAMLTGWHRDDHQEPEA